QFHESEPTDWGVFRPAASLGRSIRLVLGYRRLETRSPVPVAGETTEPTVIPQPARAPISAEHKQPLGQCAADADRADAIPPHLAAAQTAPDKKRNNAVDVWQDTRQQNHCDEHCFHLEHASPVVDAPSIGPRTAERLQEVNIHTVGDLLAADPQELAQQLAYRRINAKTITTWQQQSTLVCQIPNLRGHDAQVLVACGFHDAAAVASQDPRELFDIVGPFVETKKGQRLLRSAKKPDLPEVTNWVAWAQQTDPRKAA
ncbi:MAG: DUF4332 domain-containing protein, partial [Planctomycetota bacterium]|nr:DUF4332 domain-containing protein [Planctomycetota bacterium]